MRVLVVEDDALIQEGLNIALTQQGYACDCTGSAKQADALLNSAHYSLIILDLGLPDGDGRQLLAHWRRQQKLQPVLILTARDTLEDRVSGLDDGADDYLVKPFALTELLARVRALIRRHQGASDNSISVGNLNIDLNSQQVRVDNQSVILTPKEFSLLSRLVLKAGQPVHRELLHQDIYSWNDDPASNSLEVHMHRLRQKIGKARIRTLRGFGYQLSAEDEA